MESEDENEVLLVDLSERLAARTLGYLNGKRSANQVARALQSDFGGFDQKLHRAAMKFMHNLITIRLLEVAP